VKFDVRTWSRWSVKKLAGWPLRATVVIALLNSIMLSQYSNKSGNSGWLHLRMNVVHVYAVLNCCACSCFIFATWDRKVVLLHSKSDERARAGCRGWKWFPWRTCRDAEAEFRTFRSSAVVWRLRNRNNSQQTEWLLSRLGR